MSDWKQGAARRRDTRQAKDPEPRPLGGSKRDTKRWCRGKVGVEHTSECRVYVETKGHVGRMGSALKRWRVLVCTTCGKELATWFGHGDKPAWVTTPSQGVSGGDRG